MADVPELTDAEFGYLRGLTEEIRLDMMKVHHLCEFTLGMDHITPKGREALAAYDAKQCRAIRVEAMWECLGALIRLANRSDATIGLGVRAACDAVEEVLDAEEANG